MYCTVLECYTPENFHVYILYAEAFGQMDNEQKLFIVEEISNV